MGPKYKEGDELFVVLETLGEGDVVDEWDVYHATVVDLVNEFDGASYWIDTDSEDTPNLVVPENRLFESADKARRVAKMQG